MLKQTDTWQKCSVYTELSSIDDQIYTNMLNGRKGDRVCSSKFQILAMNIIFHDRIINGLFFLFCFNALFSTNPVYEFLHSLDINNSHSLFC